MSANCLGGARRRDALALSQPKRVVVTLSPPKGAKGLKEVGRLARNSRSFIRIWRTQADTLVAMTRYWNLVDKVLERWRQALSRKS